MSLLDAILNRWPFCAFAVSAAMLGIAHAFETFGGLLPCHLCLEERQVYWVALPIAGVAAASLFTPYAGLGRRIGGAALALTFASGAYLAGFHAGAEWGWWPAPESCAAGAKATLQGMLALVHGASAATPACDKAPWLFLGISMAGWNFVASVGLVGLSMASVFKPKNER